MLLTFCRAPSPSSNPTSKSQVGLNLTIVGRVGTQEISASCLPIGKIVVKLSHGIKMVMYGMPHFIDTTCPHLYAADKLREQCILECVYVFLGQSVLCYYTDSVFFSGM